MTTLCSTPGTFGRLTGVAPRELSPIEDELEATEPRGELLKTLPGRNRENADEMLASDGDETRLGFEAPPARYDLDLDQPPNPRLMLPTTTAEDSLVPPISDDSASELTVLVKGN